MTEMKLKCGLLINELLIEVIRGASITDITWDIEKVRQHEGQDHLEVLNYTPVVVGGIDLPRQHIACFAEFKDSRDGSTSFVVKSSADCFVLGKTTYQLGDRFPETIECDSLESGKHVVLKELNRFLELNL